MKFHQRDIVEVNFLFPDGTYKTIKYNTLYLESCTFKKR